MNLSTVLGTLANVATRLTLAAKGDNYAYATGYQQALHDVARLMEVEIDPAQLPPARPSRGFASVFEEGQGE